MFRPAAAYTGIAYAAGFLFGVVRTLVVTPAVGPLYAVLLEAPLMLAVSWLACGWVMRRFAVPPAARVRLIIGALAFVLLMGVELAVALVLFNQTPATIAAGFATAAGLVGLAAQAAFALMPWLRTIR